MIYTLTMNPALDFVVTMPSLQLKQANFYDKGQIFPGGKGINVSLLLSRLGMRNIATGICMGFTGREIMRLLSKCGVTFNFVFGDSGDSRINLKLNSEQGETELNGRGPQLNSHDLRDLMRQMTDIKVDDTLVISGSLPDFAPKSYYDDILKRVVCRTVVDVKNPIPLLKYNPFLIKPNHIELGEMFNTTISTRAQVGQYGEKLLELGAQNVLISMGAQGAMFLSQNLRLLAGAPSGRAASPCGAGDSMVAGFLFGYEKNRDFREALQWGVAAGSATAFTEGIASRQEVLHELQQDIPVIDLDRESDKKYN